MEILILRTPDSECQLTAAVPSDEVVQVYAALAADHPARACAGTHICQLVVSADTALAGASLSISVGGTKCAALSNANVTDHPLAGCGALKTGGAARLTVALAGEARLYTVGFA